MLVCRADDAANVARLGNLEAAPDGIPGAFKLEGGRLARLEEWDLQKK